MASNYDIESQAWQVGKSLADSLHYMLENHVSCDVTFAIQSAGKPDVKIQAHKVILQARSPVFEAMFSEASAETGGDVLITDMDPKTFQDLLRYMYTDEITLTGDNVIPLLYAARRYISETLEIECNVFLDNEMSVDNVCSILTHSVVQQDEWLVNFCLDFIAPNAQEVVQKESFYKMSHDALLKVVRCDRLAHGAEADLFQACIEWGKRRTNDPDNATGEEIRDVIGTECLHKIRFPYIPFKEFGAKFGEMSVLTDREKLLIYQLLATNQESHCKALSDLGFDLSSRMHNVRRVQMHICSATLEANITEEFVFSVNKPIQLRGFSIFGGEEDSKHDVKITIHKSTSEDPCIVVDRTITALEDWQPIQLYCKKLRVVVNTEYRVRVEVKGTNKIGYACSPISPIKTGELIIVSKFIQYIKVPCYQGSVVAEFLFQFLLGTSE